MTQKTTSKGQWRRTIYLASGSELIESIAAPLVTEARVAVENVIELEGQQIQTQFQQEQEKDLEQARARQHQTESRLDKVRHRLTVLSDELDLLLVHQPSFFLAVLYLLCAAAAVVTEYILNDRALNFVLDNPSGSFLAFATAVSPAVALILLEVIIERCFEGPWRNAHRATPSVKGKRPYVVMFIFLALLALVNLFAVGLLGLARGEALHLQALLLSNGPAGELNTTLIGAVILTVSLIVAINGAYFLLLGRLEASKYLQLFKSRWQVARLRSREEKLEVENHEAAAEVETQRKVAESDESHLLAEHYQQQHYFELAQKLDYLHDQEPVLSYVELVSRKLAHAVNERANGWQPIKKIVPSA